MRKDRAILDLLTSLELSERGWVVVDNWHDSLAAVGIAARLAPDRLVYVSTWQQEPGAFSYECEEPVDDESLYRVVATGEGVTFDELLRVLEEHLGKAQEQGSP
jgi:hypothetical protein